MEEHSTLNLEFQGLNLVAGSEREKIVKYLGNLFCLLYSMNNGATTFSIMTLSTITFSIMDLFVTLSIKETRHKHKVSLF